MVSPLGDLISAIVPVIFYLASWFAREAMPAYMMFEDFPKSFVVFYWHC